MTYDNLCCVCIFIIKLEILYKFSFLKLKKKRNYFKSVYPREAGGAPINVAEQGDVQLISSPIHVRTHPHLQ